jgi:hypothetical protein
MSKTEVMMLSTIEIAQRQLLKRFPRANIDELDFLVEREFSSDVAKVTVKDRLANVVAISHITYEEAHDNLTPATPTALLRRKLEALQL